MGKHKHNEQPVTYVTVHSAERTMALGSLLRKQFKQQLVEEMKNREREERDSCVEDNPSTSASLDFHQSLLDRHA